MSPDQPDQPDPRPDEERPRSDQPDRTPGPPDLGQVRAELEARRDRTRERVATLAKRPERGSSLGFGKRIGDGTTEAIGRLTDIGVGGELEHSLARTERALAKLDEGTYGICDSCGEPISPGRLRALPDGVLCLECSSKAPRPRPSRRR
jgi:DnaK suppressor protein